MGSYNTASGNYSTALGLVNKASKEQASAIGAFNTASGDGASAVGLLNDVSGKVSAGVGYNNIISGDSTYVFGANNTITAKNALVLGTSVTGTIGDGAIVLGKNITGSVAANSVVIGDGSTSEKENTVSVGTTGGERKIVHVKDGEENTDAATYGQLVNAQATKDSSGNVTGYTAYELKPGQETEIKNNAGGTAFKLKLNLASGESDTVAIGSNAAASGENSVVIGKDSAVTGKNAIAVGVGHTVCGENSGAFGDPDNVHGHDSYAFGNNNVIGDHSRDGEVGNNTFVLGNNVTTTANNAVVLGNNSTAEEDNVVSVGSDENQRKIIHVAPGEKDTDAVNVSQLKQSVSTLSQDLNKVGAGAAALAALHPEGFDAADKWSFAVGYGHYKNANAGALGAFYKPNFDTTLSIGGTIGNGDSMLNAGFSFKLGQRGAKLSRHASDSQLVKEVNALRAENAEQAEEIRELKAQMAKVLAKLGE